MARLIQGHDDEWVLRDEWTVEDILSCAEDNGYKKLTYEDCINVMKIAETGFDANVGLNWESIGAAIDYYFDCKIANTPMYYRGQPIKVTA